MDISVEGMYRVLFGLEYVGLASIEEFDFRIRQVRDRGAMRYIDFK